MSRGGVEIRVDFGRLPRMLRDDPGRVAVTMQDAALDAAGAFVQTILAVETPVGATGKARQSVHAERSTPDEVFVGYGAPASSYIAFANDGTAPHRPPWGPVAYWAIRKGLPPGAVYGSIRKRGTKAQRFVERATERARGPVAEIMVRAATAALRKMGVR